MKIPESIRKNPMYKFLLILVLSLSAGFQAWRTLFNNYAVETIGLNGFDVGTVQSIRELAGLLTFMVVVVLIYIKEHRLAVISVIVSGIGIMLTGVFPSYIGLLATTFIMSLGFHYFETINQSLSLQYFSHKETPIAMASIKSKSAIVNIAVGGLVWFLSGHLSLNIQYIIFGGFIVIMGIAGTFINPTNKKIVKQTKRFVFRKKYWLYYALSFLSGARRQVFIVFAVFMLVKKYDFSVQMVTILFIVNNIITFLFTPFIAKGINKFGESTMLAIEYSSMIAIFLGYAFIENMYVAGSLYILDHIFFGFAISINTYFQKTADPADIAPSVSVAFAINHISAVIIPVIGGFLWMINWQIPFVVGACLSLVSLIFTRFMIKKVRL